MEPELVSQIVQATSTSGLNARNYSSNSNFSLTRNGQWLQGVWLPKFPITIPPPLPINFRNIWGWLVQVAPIEVGGILFLCQLVSAMSFDGTQVCGVGKLACRWARTSKPLRVFYEISWEFIHTSSKQILHKVSWNLVLAFAMSPVKKAFFLPETTLSVDSKMDGSF